MNSLGIDLKVGQKVVMQGTGSEEERTVIVKGGFGMKAFLMGSALFVEFPDGTRGGIYSTEIEKLAEPSEGSLK